MTGFPPKNNAVEAKVLRSSPKCSSCSRSSCLLESKFMRPSASSSGRDCNSRSIPEISATIPDLSKNVAISYLHCREQLRGCGVILVRIEQNLQHSFPQSCGSLVREKSEPVGRLLNDGSSPELHVYKIRIRVICGLRHLGVEYRHMTPPKCVPCCVVSLVGRRSDKKADSINVTWCS